MSGTKLDTLVHYICARCEVPSRLGATKLNKVLWYSDVFAFAAHGKSITGASYIKRQFGPVPREILEVRGRLKQNGDIIEKTGSYGGYPQIQFIAMRDPDISDFSAEQISIVDSVMQAICFNHTASSISQLSHDLVWEVAQIGEEIPMAAAAFAGNVGEIDENDMAWAHREVDKIERYVASA